MIMLMMLVMLMLMMIMTLITINQCVPDDDDDEILMFSLKWSNISWKRCPTTAPATAHNTTQAQAPDSHSGANLKKNTNHKNIFLGEISKVIKSNLKDYYVIPSLSLHLKISKISKNRYLKYIQFIQEEIFIAI